LKISDHQHFETINIQTVMDIYIQDT